MRGLWLKCLGLTASVLTVAVHAAEPAPTASPVPPPVRVQHPTLAAGVSPTASLSPPQAAAFLDRPVPQGNVSGATPGNRPLAVILDRPIAQGAAPAIDPGVHQVIFQNAAPPLFRPSMRTTVEDAPMPRKMPVGMPTSVNSTPVTRMEPILGEPTPTTPMPSQGAPGGPVTTMPYANGPVISTPYSPTVPYAASQGNLEDWYSEGDPGAYGGCGCEGQCGTPGGLSGCFNCSDHSCGAPFDDTIYTSAEYLAWWIQGNRFPALVTTGPNAAMPNLMTVLGDSTMGDKVHSGARFRMGYWCDEDHCLGIEGGMFFLGDKGTSWSATSATGSPPLAIAGLTPTGAPNPILVASPLLGGSTINARLNTKMWGAEANLRRNLWVADNFYLDGILGFRSMTMEDTFNFGVMTLSNPSVIANDQFQTKNNFYGGQIGGIAHWRFGRWNLDLMSKSALGNTHQSINVAGGTTVGGTTLTGGLFTAPSNIRVQSRDQVSFVQELGLNLGYQLTDSLRATFGYNLLYWNSVARPGEQIDRVIGSPGRPALTPSSSDLWVQGFNVGLEFRY